MAKVTISARRCKHCGVVETSPLPGKAHVGCTIKAAKIAGAKGGK